jgi:acyl carrier protein
MSLLEAELRASVEDILGQTSIDPAASLIDLGISSLSLMRLIARIHGRFGVLVELDELLSGLNLTGLSELVQSRQAPAAPEADPPLAATVRAPASGPVPLTEFQMPFWEIREFLPAKRAYNETGVYVVETELDLERCRAVLERMVEAHPALRSAFVAGPDGTPVRRELTKEEIGPVVLEARDFSGEEDPLAACRARAAELARTDFPLERPPLFQAFAWRLAPGRWVVGCVLYHIIADLWSAQLLAQEAARRYAAGATGDGAEPDVPNDGGGEDLLPRWSAADVGFWREQLAGRPRPLAFPARPRPAIKSYRGGLAQRTLRHSFASGIEPVRGNLRVTAAGLTFAAFGLLLSAAASAEELIVGVPHLLRDRPETHQVVGLFLNTLPVRLKVAAGIATGEFVRAAHGQLMAAISHASYPVHLMQADAGAAPTLGRAPLYDHLFTYYESVGGTEGGHGANEIHFPSGTSKLDLSCFVTRRGDSLHCRLEYSTDLFARDEAEELLTGYETALDLILTASLLPVAEARAAVLRPRPLTGKALSFSQ